MSVSQDNRPHTELPKNFTECEYNLGHVFNHVMGTWNLFVGICSIFLNTLVIAFYAGNISRLVPFMYVTIATVDLATGVGASLSGVVLHILEVGHHESLAYYTVYGVYFITMVTFRTSALLNCTLATIRTINIVFPFYRVSKSVVGKAIGTGVLLYLGFAIFMITNGTLTPHCTMLSAYLYKPALFFGHDYDTTDGYHKLTVWLMVGIMVTMATPAFIVLLCTIIQVIHLNRTRRASRDSIGCGGGGSSPEEARQRRLTFTILLIALLFTACYLLHLTPPLFTMVTAVSPELHTNALGQVTHYILENCSMYVNAAVCPLILIVRGEALGQFLRKKLSLSATMTPSRDRRTGMVLGTLPLTPASPQ